MLRFFASLVACVSLVWLSGCGGDGKKPEDPRAAVKGTVSLDGKPMPTGQITFISGTNPPRIFEISGGSYSGEAYVGKNRIQIALMKDDPAATTSPATQINVLPAKYDASSKLSADVAADGANNFDFKLTAK